MKHYLKINGTAYTLSSLDRVLAVQALAVKITGRCLPVKSRGADKRSFPRFGEDMTTAAYVREYYSLNSNRRNFKTPPPYGDDNIKGFYAALSGRVSVPDGVDSVEVCS
tara:strand:- start:218 stop:544 length:327 start_codon:yes stop_codon:yes gene_type:complete